MRERRLATRRRLLALLLALSLLAAAALAIEPYWRGASFVVRAANVQGPVRAAAEIGLREVGERELAIPAAGRVLRARAYEPAGGFDRTALAVAGLHPMGIDEPRMMDLARQLAASGVAVVTPEIPELTRFDITAGITDAIEGAAAWLAADPRFAPDGRVSLMGISFSGGLAVVAAGRPSLRGRVASVFSLGGHHDLPRVVRYLCTGVEPVLQGMPEPPPPHDYGVVVILLAVAEQLVPPEQVEPLQDAVRRFLWASHVSGLDPEEADRQFAAVRDRVGTLPQPSATLLEYVADRNAGPLGARLAPYVGAYGTASGLSPARSPQPTAPVFLLHGTRDNVIPSAEAVYLARSLHDRAPVRLILSDLISHAAAVRPPTAGELYGLTTFWGALLSR